jgi:hypothetical protein
MNITIEQFDRIEAYLKGQLNGAEKQVFEQEIASNPALTAEVETQRKLRLGFETIAIENRIKAAHQRYENGQKKVIPLNNSKSNFTYWVAAASIVLVVGFFYQQQYYISSDTMRLVDEEIQYKSLPIEIPNDASVVEKQQLLSQKANWYMTLVLLKKGEKKKAKIRLQRMVDTPNHPYQSKAKRLLDRL